MTAWPDDPLEPFMATGPDQLYRDWLDFADRICKPMIELDEEAAAEAFVLFRKANPYSIAVCLVIAAATVRRLRNLEGNP